MTAKSGRPEGMSMRRNLHQEEEQEERMRGRTRGRGRSIEGDEDRGKEALGGFQRDAGRGRET